MQAEPDRLRSNREFWQSKALEVTFFVTFETQKSETQKSETQKSEDV